MTKGKKAEKGTPVNIRNNKDEDVSKEVKMKMWKWKWIKLGTENEESWRLNQFHWISCNWIKIVNF